MSPRLALLAPLVAAAVLGACAREADAPAARTDAAERVVVRGATVEAATGAPLAGVRVTAPDGTTAVSGADGRFELAGLPEGLSGALRAEGAAGLRAENPLRPLAPGVLEVVLRLRAP